jgi:hypothetical protein
MATNFRSVAPYSQTIALAWRPDLRFFETRTQLLRSLEEDGNLAAFRWTENVIGARLGRSEVLEFWSGGATLFLANSPEGLAIGQQALTRIFETITPGVVGIREALFQFVLAIDENYDVLRRRTANAVLGGAMPGETITDWSAVADGVSEAANSRYNLEFGIINAEEALNRLSRRVGHIHHPTVAPIPDDVWTLDELPACALFVDSRWVPAGNMARAEGGQEVVDKWAALASEGGRIATKVYEQFQQGGTRVGAAEGGR